MKTIYVITCSIRQERIGDSVAKFVMENIKTNHKVTQIDLKDWLMPYLDEGMPSASDSYETEGANDWAAKINQADGFVFVTPEYNASIPAQLKNNIDVIYDEWLEKSALIVSYSESKAGGASAASHLKDILERLKMDLSEPVSFSGWGTDYDDKQTYRSELTTSFEQFKSLLG